MMLFFTIENYIVRLLLNLSDRAMTVATFKRKGALNSSLRSTYKTLYNLKFATLLLKSFCIL